MLTMKVNFTFVLLFFDASKALDLGSYNKLFSLLQLFRPLLCRGLPSIISIILINFYTGHLVCTLWYVEWHGFSFSPEITVG